MTELALFEAVRHQTANTWRVLGTKDIEGADNLNPGSIHRHQYHALLLVSGSAGVGLACEHSELCTYACGVVAQ